MPKLSHKYSNEPCEKLDFSVNFMAHMEAIKNNHIQLLYDVGEYFGKNKIRPTCIEKLNFFTPIRDIYDSIDEISGVICLPIAGIGFSLFCAMSALRELFHQLAISCNIVDNDIAGNKEESHGNQALYFAIAAIAAIVCSLLGTIKFAISVITRSLATLVRSNTDECNFPPDKTSEDNHDNEDFRFNFA